MSSRIDVIQGVHCDGKLFEVFRSELCVLDVPVVSHDMTMGVEAQRRFAGNDGFGLSNMFLAEQELSVEVAHIDNVEVDLSRIRTAVN